MSCNSSKCRELIFRKESGIAQLKDLALLGLIFQGDSKSSSHVKIKLTKQQMLARIKDIAQRTIQPG